MRDAIKAVPLMIVALLCAGCATGTHSISVRGRPTDITHVSAAGSSTVEGELIAVDEGRVWILEKSGLSELPRAEIARMRVQRHELTGRRGMQWAALGALLTGGALAVSCASVSGGCSGILPAVAVPWLVTGLLAKPSLDASSRMTLAGPRLDEARPYARFPQGLPPRFVGPPAPSVIPGTSTSEGRPR